MDSCEHFPSNLVYSSGESREISPMLVLCVTFHRLDAT